MPSHILELPGTESVETFKALASETRVKILALLTEGDMNIMELAQALNISQPNVTKHIQILEEAGLVISDYSSGVQGTQKRCHRSYDRFIISFENPDSSPALNLAEVEMPVGLYSVVSPVPTCGLAGHTGLIGYIDNPVSFYFPNRSEAQILWMADGFVEYIFPNTLPPAVTIQCLELVMEVGSETPGYDVNYPSDITVWINGIEIGTWRSPGDMGGKRGRLNPSWWGDNMNQYGLLKVWMINGNGSYVDGIHVSNTTIREVNAAPWQPTTVRIGIKPDAENRGGFTLFGRGFGNYEQDLILRLRHSGKERRGKDAQCRSGG